MTPELWATGEPVLNDFDHHAIESVYGLRRVPFDEAVERMADSLMRVPLVPTHKKDHLRKRCTDLLRAALGEDTE